MPEDLFTNRKPDEFQARALDFITASMQGVADDLNAVLPVASRYRSLALTKLEECSMWAKKAVLFS